MRQEECPAIVKIALSRACAVIEACSLSSPPASEKIARQLLAGVIIEEKQQRNNEDKQ